MEKLYWIEEAAPLLRLHPETVRRLYRQGTILGQKSGQRITFTESQIDAYLRSEFVEKKREEYARLGKRKAS